MLIHNEAVHNMTATGHPVASHHFPPATLLQPQFHQVLQPLINQHIEVITGVQIILEI